MSDYSTWRAANPDASHFSAYQAGYEAARADIYKEYLAALNGGKFSFLSAVPSSGPTFAEIGESPIPAPPKEQG